MSPARAFALSFGLLGAVFMSGCASVKRDVATSYSPVYVLTKSQYEQVDVTGSKLQVLVPTAGTVAALPPMSPVTVMSASAFRAAMMPGRGPTRR